jgi:Pyridoxamine 5'-phosphate oxidase
MRETWDDLVRLHTLLARSIEQAGPYLRSSFQMPERSLSASQLTTYLEGIRFVSLATVTARGEPRAAPAASLFYRAAFYIPTVKTAARVLHLARRPGVSLTHFVENELAIIVHGHAAILTPANPAFAVLEELHRSFAGQSVRDWGEAVFLRVDADAIYTYAREPDLYPGDRPME